MQALTGCQRESAVRGRLGDDHRAGAAVALGAAFLGAGEPAALAQELEQRRLRRGVGDADVVAVEQETDGVGHRSARWASTPVSR